MNWNREHGVRQKSPEEFLNSTKNAKEKVGHVFMNLQTHPVCLE